MHVDPAILSIYLEIVDVDVEAASFPIADGVNETLVCVA